MHKVQANEKQYLNYDHINGDTNSKLTINYM